MGNRADRTVPSEINFPRKCAAAATQIDATLSSPSVCSPTQSAAAAETRIEVENFYPFSRFDAKPNHGSERRGRKRGPLLAGHAGRKSHNSHWETQRINALISYIAPLQTKSVTQMAAEEALQKCGTTFPLPPFPTKPPYQACSTHGSSATELFRAGTGKVAQDSPRVQQDSGRRRGPGQNSQGGRERERKVILFTALSLSLSLSHGVVTVVLRKAEGE